MGLEVDFITLGDASDRIGVPSATLRHWTDQLEEFEVHFVLRNNRNERIYFDTDIVVFTYLRDLKQEYGRRTTTRDLAYMIADKGKEGEFELRSKEEAPTPQHPSNRTADLLNQEDIQRLMQSERVKQFIGVVIAENTKALREDIIEEIRESVRDEIRQEIEESNKKMEDIATRIETSLQKRDEQMTNWIAEQRRKSEEETLKIEEEKQSVQEEPKKGFFTRLFGG